MITLADDFSKIKKGDIIVNKLDDDEFARSNIKSVNKNSYNFEDRR